MTTVRLPGAPPVRIDAGTALSVVLIGAITHPILAARVPSPTLALLLAGLVGLGMLASVLVHEAAHAAVARAFGAQVDHIALTLTGGHTQYRAARMRSLPAALISAAGPLSNLALGALLALLRGTDAQPTAMGLVVGILSTLNYGLAIFNALPGLPLDGGRTVQHVLAAVTGRPARAEWIAAWTGRVLAVLLVAVAIWQLSAPRGGPIAPVTYAVITVVIASQLWMGASAALRRHEKKSARQGPE